MPSPHEVIPIDRGISGAAIREKTTIVVPDVQSDPRFLACSPTTRSEIVVPIFDRQGKPVAEIDVDSDLPDAFSADDKTLLEKVSQRLSQLF